MPNVFKKLTQRLKGLRFFTGDGALPAPIVLTQHRVFILPTRAGMVFAMLVFLMLLASVNYSNSLGFILTFILASLMVVSILHTYRNLYKLTIDLGRIPSTFVGADVAMPVILDNRERVARYAIGLHHIGCKKVYCDISSNSHHIVNLKQRADIRGWQPTSRITLETYFPLGLFRAWALVQVNRNHLVYPRPELQYTPVIGQQSASELSGGQVLEGDDFAGLRSYRIGDSLRHVHWKLAAQGRGLHTKHFSGNQSDEIWLDWRSITVLETEPRLSRLTRWVIEAEKQGDEYGLWLPDCIVQPGSGDIHQHQCLKALALYGNNDYDERETVNKKFADVKHG